jgi:hypothetical protein
MQMREDAAEGDAPMPGSPMPHKERWIVAKYGTRFNDLIEF